MKSFLFLCSFLFLLSCTDEPTGTETPPPPVAEASPLASVWQLERINGKEAELDLMERRPMLDLNPERKIVAGDDGCNRFSGQIKLVNEERLMFGVIGGTRAECANAYLYEEVNTALRNTRAYKISGDKLMLYANGGQELMTLTR